MCYACRYGHALDTGYEPHWDDMTLDEFFDALDEGPLQRIEVERLGRLSAFTPMAQLADGDIVRVEEAKRRIRDEIARRSAVSARLEESAFRRRERHEADVHHGEHVAQSGRMHVAQMERAHAQFVGHRKFMWLALVIAVGSALLAWASLWRQRDETREALEDVMRRLEVLEARMGVKSRS